MYYGQHTQTGEMTAQYSSPYVVLAVSGHKGWEDCETEIMESATIGIFDVYHEAEFPCTYYGDYTCELSSNRPDSLCPFHAGEED